MNLYAYAGNNPVAFTDPFGLVADTIDASPEVREMLWADCKEPSDYCDTLDWLDHHSTVWSVDTTSQPLPANALSGYTKVNYEYEMPVLGIYTRRVTGGNILIRPADFATNSRQEGGLPVTFGTTAAHEVGHAVGNILATNRYPLQGIWKKCGEPCAKGVENHYRRQVGLQQRP